MHPYFRPAIVLCSRTNSDRLPNKVFRKINGTPILIHLLRQLTKAEIPVIVAVPNSQREEYESVLNTFPDLKVILHSNDFSEDPLARMADVVASQDLTHVVRVTHDKIFVDIENLKNALVTARGSNVDYLYSSDLLPGTGFEVLSAQCVLDASAKFKNVEHISYAARLVSKTSINLSFKTPLLPHNLLIDFPEDLQFMEALFSQLSPNPDLKEVTGVLSNEFDLSFINMPPKVSVYICAKNAENTIKKAMQSVVLQAGFSEWGELILIDDHSTDRTCIEMAKFASGRHNVSWVRNHKNLGLASSSNIGLKLARGKYIVRLDADDFFVDMALNRLISAIETSKSEIVYPDNYFGGYDKIQKGNECHHVGGAIFDRRALNFIKFTDGLRNLEGFDLFLRARNTLKISYLNDPVFFYTQNEKSMSKTNLVEREQTRKELIEMHGVGNVAQIRSH